MEKNKTNNQNDISFFIQPWTTYNEFIECYTLLFGNIYNNNITNLNDFFNNLKTSNLKEAEKYLAIWENRNDNVNLTLSSILLLNMIIKLKDEKFSDNIIDCQVLGEVIIRVSNLIVDDLKKTKKTSNLNMFLVAKEINLPDYIIQIRHSCTHKNLPNYNTLVLGIKYLFFWLKENMWDIIYKKIELENKVYLGLIDSLNKESTNIFPNFENNDERFNFEIPHLMNLIQKIFVSFYFKVKCVKSKDTQGDIIYKSNLNSTKIDFIDTIIKYIFGIEKEFFVLLLFQFITQQIFHIFEVREGELNEGEKEIMNKNDSIILFFCKYIQQQIHFTQSEMEIETYIVLIKDIKKKLEMVIEINDKYISLLDIFNEYFNQNLKESSEESESSEEVKENSNYNIFLYKFSSIQ